MSVRVMSWVYDDASTTNPTDQAVLLAIADRCDDEGCSAYPAVASIARKTRLDDRSVRRAIGRLEKLGLLTIARGKGRHGTNVYAVVMTAPTAGVALATTVATGRTVTPDTQSPLTDSHPSPDTQSVPPGQTVIPPPDRQSADPSSTSCTSRTSVSALRARFDRFWASYPRRVGKEAAWNEWKRIMPRPDDAFTDAAVAAVERQRTSAQWQCEGGQYIPHPRTWLHQGRWQDDVDPGQADAPAPCMGRAVPDTDDTACFLAELRAARG